jgi:hypothetical protein
MKRAWLGLLLGALALGGAARAEEGWTTLFNGKDLAGWKSVGRGHWTVEEGAIVGRNDAEKPGNYWLVSDQEYDNFVLRLKYWITAGGNSGVAVRDPSRAQGPQTPAHIGYEIQILDRKGAKMPNGSIYLIQPAVEGLHRSEEWNEMEIRCQGPHIEVWVNGTKAAETEHTRSARGALGFQIHDRNAVVKFKDIQIKKLH